MRLAAAFAKLTFWKQFRSYFLGMLELKHSSMGMNFDGVLLYCPRLIRPCPVKCTFETYVSDGKVSLVAPSCSLAARLSRSSRTANSCSAKKCWKVRWLVAIRLKVSLYNSYPTTTCRRNSMWCSSPRCAAGTCLLNFRLSLYIFLNAAVVSTVSFSN